MKNIYCSFAVHTAPPRKGFTTPSCHFVSFPFTMAAGQWEGKIMYRAHRISKYYSLKGTSYFVRVCWAFEGRGVATARQQRTSGEEAFPSEEEIVPSEDAVSPPYRAWDNGAQLDFRQPMCPVRIFLLLSLSFVVVVRTLAVILVVALVVLALQHSPSPPRQARRYLVCPLCPLECW
jgi:hypothetical protein